MFWCQYFHVTISKTDSIMTRKDYNSYSVYTHSIRKLWSQSSIFPFTDKKKSEATYPRIHTEFISKFLRFKSCLHLQWFKSLQVFVVPFKESSVQVTKLLKWNPMQMAICNQNKLPKKWLPLFFPSTIPVFCSSIMGRNSTTEIPPAWFIYMLENDCSFLPGRTLLKAQEPWH